MALQQTEINLCEALHMEMITLSAQEQAVFHHCFCKHVETQNLHPETELKQSIQSVQEYKLKKQQSLTHTQDSQPARQ